MQPLFFRRRRERQQLRREKGGPLVRIGTNVGVALGTKVLGWLMVAAVVVALIYFRNSIDWGPKPAEYVPDDRLRALQNQTDELSEAFHEFKRVTANQIRGVEIDMRGHREELNDLDQRVTK